MPVNQIRDFEQALYKYVDTTNPGLLSTIMKEKTLDDKLKEEMSRLIKEAKQQFIDSRQESAKTEQPSGNTEQQGGKNGPGSDGTRPAKKESTTARESKAEADKQVAVKH
jgi:hypothetical protein